MNNKLQTLLIFIVPVTIIGLINHEFMKRVDLEKSTFDTRVRYLDITSGEESRIDALPEIYIEGEINETTLEEFKSTVSRHHLTDAKVVFNSQGGNLDIAIELGYLIRRNGFSTSVGEYTQTWDDSGPAGCYSACTVAFLGGVYRYFSPPSEFGVHQYRSVGIDNDYSHRMESAAQRFSGEFLEYIKDMGIATDFYQKTVFQDHEDIELLSMEELTEMNVVNNGAYPAEWTLTMNKSVAELIGKQKRIGQDGTTTIRCDKGIDILFKSNRRSISPRDADSLKFSLYSDGGELPINDLVQSKVVSGPDSHLLVSFRPDSDSLLAIFGSESFGLIYEDANGERFLQNIDISKNRVQLSEFIRNCQI